MKKIFLYFVIYTFLLKSILTFLVKCATIKSEMICKKGACLGWEFTTDTERVCVKN